MDRRRPAAGRCDTRRQLPHERLERLARGRRSTAGAASPRRSCRPRAHRLARVPSASIAARIISNESIMMLPTRSIFGAGTPSRARFSSASGDGVQSTSQIASVTRRLISSGMRAVAAAQAGLEVRRPGSRASAPTSAHAAVEFTSPTTTIQSGRLAQRDLLVRDHDAAGLLGVRAAADLRGGSAASAGRGRGRTRPTCSRRSAGRCARSAARTSGSRASAWYSGAIFMKFGRAAAIRWMFSTGSLG